MPFRLKNAVAIYQRSVSGIFKDIMESIVKVYVDNMVVKCRSLEEHPEDIQRVFGVLARS